MRVARATENLDEVARMYREGLGMEELGAFADHEGFDGVILGWRAGSYQVEFTRRRGHAVARVPDADDLLVFYYPDEADWERVCARMAQAGFRTVPAVNPYWDRAGRTFADVDGCRVVVQRDRAPGQA